MVNITSTGRETRGGFFMPENFAESIKNTIFAPNNLKQDICQ